MDLPVMMCMYVCACMHVCVPIIIISQPHLYKVVITYMIYAYYVYIYVYTHAYVRMYYIHTYMHTYVYAYSNIL